MTEEAANDKLWIDAMRTLRANVEGLQKAGTPEDAIKCMNECIAREIGRCMIYFAMGNYAQFGLCMAAMFEKCKKTCDVS